MILRERQISSFLSTGVVTYQLIDLSCSRKFNNMNQVLLSAFYDNVNKNVGPTLMWVLYTTYH